jgi:hypothetical protein
MGGTSTAELCVPLPQIFGFIKAPRPGTSRQSCILWHLTGQIRNHDCSLLERALRADVNRRLPAVQEPGSRLAQRWLTKGTREGKDEILES